MGLFESREEREARHKVAIRMAQKRVHQFAAQCRSMSNKYNDMALAALRMNNQAKCDQYLCSRLRYQKESERWGSLALHLEDVSLRGEMSGAMKSVASGMTALAKEINANVSMQEITEAVSTINASMMKLERVEEMFTAAMGQLDTPPMPEEFESDNGDIPEEFRLKVSEMREHLMSEVIAQEKGGSSWSRERDFRDMDSRIAKSRERLNELRRS